jgi:TP901 family phage tail tape measure protein
MEVLEASLKAAAIGLGETKTISDLATSALNAYGSANLSATEATDVMVTAVREGKLEASELAQSMGRVLPLASAMGVEFHEVGAAFAALSRTGTNAAEASTQVRGILASLLKPTQQAEEALSEMGLSSKELRLQLREKGLLSTLQTLQKNFEGNDEASSKVFGNVRALSGVLDLMGANAEGTAEIFNSLTNSLNATSEAFEVVEESVSQKLDKSIAKLGNDTIPFFQGALLVVTDTLNGLISTFQILGDVGGPSGDLKRQIDANKKSLDEFTASGKQASKEMKKLFALPFDSLLGDDKDKQEDLLLANILTFEKGEDKPKEVFNTLEEFNKTFKTNFKDLSEITNEVQFELFLLNDTANLLTTTTRGMAEGLDFSKLKLLDFKSVVEDTAKMQKQFALISNVVTAGMNLFFDALNNPEGFDNFLKGIKKVIVQLLKQLAIMTAISAIFALVTGKSFADVFKSVSGLGKPSEGFKLFAQGGIVTSPVAGIVGEAGPEAVIPLNRLPQMLGATSGSTRGEFTLRGQDLILALERAGDFRARITG